MIGHVGMIDVDFLEYGCTCFKCPPCSFCTSLSETEADIYAGYGLDALKKYVRGRVVIGVCQKCFCGFERRFEQENIVGPGECDYCAYNEWDTIYCYDEKGRVEEWDFVDHKKLFYQFFMPVKLVVKKRQKEFVFKEN